MIRTTAVLFVLLTPAAASEVSMNDQIVAGHVTDGRISRCGLMVSTQTLALLRPFIETSSPLGGTVKLSVVKRSSSGTSQTNQSWVFSGGSLGATQVGIDLPAAVSVRLDVIGDTGATLCALQQDLNLERDAHRR